jgi:hypothetical protein
MKTFIVAEIWNHYSNSQLGKRVKNLLLLLILTGNSSIYSQDFYISSQDEQILQNIHEESNYIYEFQQQGWIIEGFEEEEIISIVSIGNIIERSIPHFTTNHEKAVFLNKIGFSYYENKKYRIACHFFAYAFFVDSTYKYSAYNYACSDALIDLEQDRISPGSRFGGVIEVYLNEAINLDPSYKTKMRIDSDLRYYYHEPWFIVLSGADINTRGGIIELLTNTEVWYGPKPGVYPQSPELYFQKDGTVIIKSFSMKDDKFNWITKSGRYTVHEGYFIFQDSYQSYRGIVEKIGNKYYLKMVDSFTNVDYFTTAVDYSA